jgi:hypothetical protein
MTEAPLVLTPIRVDDADGLIPILAANTHRRRTT